MSTRVLTLALLAATAGLTTVASQSRPDYPFQPVPFTSVHLNDVFWAPRIETNRQTTIPVAFQQCERTQRVYHFERAAKALRGEPLEDTRPPGYPFDDTDLYKVIEGASYTLNVHPDPKLDAYVDGLIAKIAAAQEPDGYIYTTRTINPKQPHRWAGTERWQLERDDSHELYNVGHLYEAAVAHHRFDEADEGDGRAVRERLAVMSGEADCRVEPVRHVCVPAKDHRLIDGDALHVGDGLRAGLHAVRAQAARLWRAHPRETVASVVLAATVIADKPAIDAWIKAGVKDSKKIAESQIIKLDKIIRETPGASV